MKILDASFLIDYLAGAELTKAFYSPAAFSALFSSKNSLRRKPTNST
jgi:hypothetical protein